MRPIDADALFDFLTEQLDKETGAYSKGRNAGINIARSALHDKAITPTIVPPPNDPLTLEELLEMDGEPVWFEAVYNDCGYECGWAIVSTEYERIAGNSTYFLFEDFGCVWNAYRRKPKGGTADG